MIFKKILFRLFIFLILFISFTLKSFSLEPEKFVQSVVNEASSILTENFTKEQKIEKLESIAKETVDIKGIGYYSLGSHKKSLSDEKKKRISRHF